ncbi:MULTISPECIES: RebB family R body protein [Rhodospirillales]|uniref:R body protein, putative n=2 Tax=Rhodospirillales TaxID=204441 RepID=B6INX1_RHOCS|nr:RebB family R body protein [Rhodospirillum centenum]ACI99391.1 R body protein, putative [Rhodospirillum centenum SW]
MANTTLVNGQITDAVTQANVKVLGDAPAQALSSVYQAAAQSTGLSMQNATSNQQNKSTITTAVTTQAVNLLYSMPVAAGARGTNAIFSGNATAEMLAQLKSVLQATKVPAPIPGRGP